MAIESDKKFKAVWVSHSSMSDFLRCPRLYYLSNIYRNPKTGNKISIVNPFLVLGIKVHSILESLSLLPSSDRFNDSLVERFDRDWKNLGFLEEAFRDKYQLEEFGKAGRDMIRMVEENPGPLKNLAVKIRDPLPQFWLSEEDNIILCGKIDWLEYSKEKKGVRLIDFKTGRNKERKDSLQLPIYRLLVENCQSHNVFGASYWYLRSDREPEDINLPSSKESKELVLNAALKVKEARDHNQFNCPHNGCRYCEPYERIIRGEGKLIGQGEHGNDLYVLK
jgi:ATP-dependent helicase/DNAse subunit B